MKNSNLFKAAWGIAAKAAKKFGGKKSEYFQMSLKRAWELNRGSSVDKISIPENIFSELTSKCSSVDVAKRFKKSKVTHYHIRLNSDHFDLYVSRGTTKSETTAFFKTPRISSVITGVHADGIIKEAKSHILN